MESRHNQQQGTPDHQRIISAGSNSHPQRTSPCPNHFQDSTTARTVLATILEIIAVSGDDLNLAYPSSHRRKCPMLKCFHISATPMEQIIHVASCAEASKGEIQCWTCQKCHEFKKWQTMCNTLKSPVELLRRLSNRKRGSNTSAGEPFVSKRGKIAVNDEFTIPSRQESHGVESVWPPEMEDPTSFPSHEVALTPSPVLELDAEVNNVQSALQPRNFQTARPLPTPPSTRNHSWSENSQSLVDYGDAKITHVPEQPPPYVVSPQTTVDDYQLHGNPTDSLRLGIPPVQYINESIFMESPEDIELPEAPWADHSVFSETEEPPVDLQFLSTARNVTASAQYGSRSEKTASIFRSFPASRMPNPRIQKQNTWPVQLDCSSDIPGPPPFEHQQRQTFNGFPGLTEHNVPAATANHQDARTRPSVARQTSFDAGAQDSITVSVPDDKAQTGGIFAPEDKHYQALPSRRAAAEQHAAAQQQQQQYEECGRCGQRFRGIPKNRKQHLKRHVASKHGDVRFRCAHAGCRRSYNRVDNLHDHERKCHRFVLHHQFEGAETMAELAAGDVEAREGGREAAERSAGGTGHPQDSGAAETHLGVFGYAVTTEEAHGWQHCVAGGDDDDARDLGARRGTPGLLIGDGWDVMMAGVSGGQQQHVDEEDVRVLDVGDDELAPRPLDLPCVSWRGYWEADGLGGAPTKEDRHAIRRR